jgi:hypothetical protein
MEAKITVNMDNAAFEGDDAAFELADCLRQLAMTLDYDAQVRAGYIEPIRDLNGNTVGKLEITD